jgi:hypothetical protein
LKRRRGDRGHGVAHPAELRKQSPLFVSRQTSRSVGFSIAILLAHRSAATQKTVMPFLICSMADQKKPQPFAAAPVVMECGGSPPFRLSVNSVAGRAAESAVTAAPKIFFALAVCGHSFL